MESVIENFIFALRNSGVRISMSESIDAMNAVKIVGVDNREILKDSLLATLTKSFNEMELFQECFEKFFSDGSTTDHEKYVPDNFKFESEKIMSPLSQMLLTGNKSDLAVPIREAASAVDITGIRFFTQKGLYINRILTHMGLTELNSDIRRIDGDNDFLSSQIAEKLKEARGALLGDIRDFVEKQFSLYSGLATEEIKEWYLRRIKLTNVERRDFEQLQKIIRKMAKRLNDVHSKRRKSHQRGQLDFKKTFRKNLKYQGYIFDPWWKMKKIDRPEVVVICDVSRSVKTVVRFLLLLIYSLNEVISKIRSFIFCSNLVDVSNIFDNYSLEEALSKMQSGNGLPIQLGSTDYGRTFSNFKDEYLNIITKKTTLIILGDARNNYGHPHAEILKLLYGRSKRLLWLNPEDQLLWGTGDSEMKRYLPYCHLAKECNTLRHLEKFVYDLLTIF